MITSSSELPFGASQPRSIGLSQHPDIKRSPPGDTRRVGINDIHSKKLPREIPRRIPFPPKRTFWRYVYPPDPENSRDLTSSIRTCFQREQNSSVPKRNGNAFQSLRMTILRLLYHLCSRRESPLPKKPSQQFHFQGRLSKFGSSQPLGSLDKL
jgi:hypothetical protein